MPLSVTEAARAALLRLVELGLPPTPENYTKYFHEMYGDTQPEIGTDAYTANLNAQIIGMVHTLMDEVTGKTALLAERLETRGGEIGKKASELQQTEEKDAMLQLLGTIVHATSAIKLEVDLTHADLVSSSQTLQQIKTELLQTRAWLQEDALTGAQNRRGLDISLAREVARCRRHGSNLTIAMIDMDHFKQVNDTYGHEVGDQALVHFTMVAKSVLRESDVLVRYGGEEFLILLPETEVNGARFMLERLQQVTRATPLVAGEHRVRLAFSGAIAQLKKDENAHSMIMRADKALYEAKKAGRNCITIATD
jgi:diguanylate cyclase